MKSPWEFHGSVAVDWDAIVTPLVRILILHGYRRTLKSIGETAIRATLDVLYEGSIAKDTVEFCCETVTNLQKTTVSLPVASTPPNSGPVTHRRYCQRATALEDVN